MSKYLLLKIKEHVKNLSYSPKNPFGRSVFDNHFQSVVKYTKELAALRNANPEIVELAAWLHDVASLTGNYENHHLAGAQYAQILLTQYDYPQNEIDQVKHCIEAHRNSQSIPRQTKEAQCLADADAMSHFDYIHDLYA